jgi:hypothetical protein
MILCLEPGLDDCRLSARRIPLTFRQPQKGEMEKLLSKLPQQMSQTIAKQGFAVISKEGATELTQTVSHFIKRFEFDTNTSGLIEAYSMDESTPEPLFVTEVDIEKKLPVVRVLSGEEEWKLFVADRKIDYALMWGSCCSTVNCAERFEGSRT